MKLKDTENITLDCELYDKQGNIVDKNMFDDIKKYNL